MEATRCALCSGDAGIRGSYNAGCALPDSYYMVYRHWRIHMRKLENGMENGMNIGMAPIGHRTNVNRTFYSLQHKSLYW